MEKSFEKVWQEQKGKELQAVNKKIEKTSQKKSIDPTLSGLVEFIKNKSLKQ